VNRISSIDVVRGLVMVIMALDHVRDWTHAPSIAWGDPTDLATTTPILFFTRWITHFCAPTFVFLAGTSIFLSMAKRGATPQSRRFLLTRGLWLVLLECTVLAFGWHFNIHFPFLGLQVIWAIGVSMIVMSVASAWSVKTNLIVGGAIVLLHNAFDWYQPTGNAPWDVAWHIMHIFTIYNMPNGMQLFFVYPVLPWIGVMMLGFAFGSLFVAKPGKELDVIQLRKTLIKLGLGVTALFVVLRTANIYGDLHTWTLQKDWMYNVLAFLNTTKYPPSLLYLCMTIGPAVTLIGLLTRNSTLPHGQMSAFAYLTVFGKVPMFYYLLHIYIGHFIGWAMCYVQGYPLSAFWDVRTFGGNPMGSGFDLWVSYLVWIVLVLLLYPLCKWYDNIKTANPQKTLFRYL